MSSYVEKYGTTSSTSNAAYGYSGSYGFTFGYDPFGEIKKQIPSYSSNLSIFNGISPLGALPAAPKATAKSANSDILATLASALIKKTSVSDKASYDKKEDSTDSSAEKMNALKASKILMKYFDEYETSSQGGKADKQASWDDLITYVENNPDNKEMAEALEYFKENRQEFNKMEVMQDKDKTNLNNLFWKSELQAYIEDLEAKEKEDD